MNIIDDDLTKSCHLKNFRKDERIEKQINFPKCDWDITGA